MNSLKVYFEDNSFNYIPVVEATVLDPLREKKIKLRFIIDTGFQGGVLIPLRAYLDLSLNMFEETKAKGTTATGAGVELRVAKAIVRLSNKEVECHAYTTLGVRRALLGREVLKQVGILYNPPSELRIPLK